MTDVFYPATSGGPPSAAFATTLADQGGDPIAAAWQDRAPTTDPAAVPEDRLPWRVAMPVIVLLSAALWVGVIAIAAHLVG